MLRLYLKELQTLCCPESVIRGGAWRVGWLGRPHDSAPAEVCKRLGLQTTEGALEGALSLSRTRAIVTGHHYVINGYTALLSTNNSFYNKLENKMDVACYCFQMTMEVEKCKKKKSAKVQKCIEVNLLLDE